MDRIYPPQLPGVSRRQWLAASAATVPLLTWQSVQAVEQPARQPKTVAAIVTAYRKGLHGDVLVGKILEGWRQDGGPGPALKLASMYVEQTNDIKDSSGKVTYPDLARPMAAKHNVPLCDTIEQALTLGSDKIAVDGVISIAEHGSYPRNEIGQHLYPRWRFFRQIAAAFEKYGRVVPVFSDKHLGPTWSDAAKMYRRARQLKIPFMAGSSLPVTFRSPDLTIPMDCRLESAVGVGYSGLDIYGSHTLDCYQCLVERRHGGERGVKSVQCLQGKEVWKAVDSGIVDRATLEAALNVVPTREDTALRASDDPHLFLFSYVDGFQGAVFMLPTYAGGISTAVKIKGRPQPLACRFEERLQPAIPHFAYLLKAVERMIHTGQPSYPVERTLLTSGILDRALTSRADNHRRIATPELEVAYQPVDYPHAPHMELMSDPVAPLRPRNSPKGR